MNIKVGDIVEFVIKGELSRGVVVDLWISKGVLMSISTTSGWCFPEEIVKINNRIQEDIFSCDL